LKTRFVLLLAGFALLAATNSPSRHIAQDDSGLIENPDLYLPAGRVDDGVLYKIREARQREKEAILLEVQKGRRPGAAQARARWAHAGQRTLQHPDR
jgi:hypothetical protein